MCINNIFKSKDSQADVQNKSILGSTGEAVLPPLVSTDMALVGILHPALGITFLERYEATG